MIGSPSLGNRTKPIISKLLYVEEEVWSDQVDFYRSQLKFKLQLRWARTFVTLFDLLYIGRLPVAVFKSLLRSKWTGHINTFNCFRESNELIITMSLWQHHDFICVRKCYIYLPLTNRVREPYRKLRTEFFPPRFMVQARSARAINRREKRGSVTYSTDRENEVSKIFITSLVRVWGAQERFLFTWNGFKFLTHLESKTSQLEIVFKSLARFIT